MKQGIAGIDSSRYDCSGTGGTDYKLQLPRRNKIIMIKNEKSSKDLERQGSSTGGTR
jgi:hypothetical protein